MNETDIFCALEETSWILYCAFERIKCFGSLNFYWRINLVGICRCRNTTRSADHLRLPRKLRYLQTIHVQWVSERLGRIWIVHFLIVHLVSWLLFATKFRESVDRNIRSHNARSHCALRILKTTTCGRADHRQNQNTTVWAAKREFMPHQETDEGMWFWTVSTYRSSRIQLSSEEIVQRCGGPAGLATLGQGDSSIERGVWSRHHYYSICWDQTKCFRHSYQICRCSYT